METDDAIYFYGTNNKFGFLSNFYMCKFTDTINNYISSEQYFMYHKCMLFDCFNDKLLNKILTSNNNSSIKKYGRQVRNFDNKIWNEHKEDIMKKGLILKFEQNKDIQDKLLDTGRKILYEASKNDKIWSIGIDIKQVGKKEPTGQNLLGKLLMDVREYISRKK